MYAIVLLHMNLIHVCLHACIMHAWCI